ncbi:hypothetical protein DAEQUDRAFT_754909 [Daedalea quercina L-15889]|uniref:Aminoglycoside phosphotransferase domain-containing protein n=1 Tax=Daedalea quercina L-15889 TaxID=1314783 RepID=A0A165T3S7_9APHY|nr:hypothetical protein DAEQUDRAFT_754909 [Daedalea quercina L-15889]
MLQTSESSLASGATDKAAAMNIVQAASQPGAPALLPAMRLDSDEYDLSDLSTIIDRTILAKLVLTRKISLVDYQRADTALRAQPEFVPPTDSRNVQVLYPQDSPPIITPQAVLGLLRSPLQRPAQITSSRRLQRINETMIVKHGNLDLTEFKTILFVREHTLIPVPTIYLVFVIDKRMYVVMEYICGGDLQHLWPSLQHSERHRVLSQVQRYIHDLRNIVPSSSIPGPIGGGVCRGRWFSDFGAGPFRTHQDLVNFWNSMFTPSIGDDVVGGRQFRADHPLVFSHCDIAPRNLIIRDGTVWMVDWEQAGWYPAYLEYAYIASEEGDWEYPTPRDWRDALLSLIPDYSQEYRMLSSILGKIARGFDPSRPLTRG